MKKLVMLAWAVGLVAAPARGQETPRAVIERAVKAHGGGERLSRVRADKVKLRGVLGVGGKEVPFTAETAVQQPDRFKNVMRLAAGSDKHTVIHILNRDK